MFMQAFNRYLAALDTLEALLVKELGADAFKFNPNHDPDDGRFSESPGGSGGGSSASDSVIDRSTATVAPKPESKPTAQPSTSSVAPAAKPAPHKFSSYTARSDFHTQEYNAYIKRLSRPQKDALNYYTGGGYDDVNHYLRDGEDINGTTKTAKRAKHLLESFSPLPEQLPVFRGINGRLKAFSTPGTIITDKAFVSTSVSTKIAKSFSRGSPKTIARFWIPKGTKVGYGNTSNEEEVILPPNSKFKVKGRVKGKDVWYVDMEYVP